MYMPENRRYIYESGVWKGLLICVLICSVMERDALAAKSPSSLAAENAAFFAGCRHGWDRTCRRLMQPGRPSHRTVPGAYSQRMIRFIVQRFIMPLSVRFLFAVFFVFIWYVVIKILTRSSISSVENPIRIKSMIRMDVNCA